MTDLRRPLKSPARPPVDMKAVNRFRSDKAPFDTPWLIHGYSQLTFDPVSGEPLDEDYA
jgi:hypothetical protein